MKNTTIFKCMHCEKKLPAVWRVIAYKGEQTPYDWTGAYGRAPIETRVKKAGTPWETTEGFFGTYGRYESPFCTLTCGHEWARRQIEFKLKGRIAV